MGWQCQECKIQVLSGPAPCPKCGHPGPTTRLRGIKEIDQAKWVEDSYGWCVLTVHDKDGYEVTAQLSLRPEYCDRGHIQLNIDGNLGIDRADSFPRFFFNTQEADLHVRTFLKWRLWKERTHPHSLRGLFDEDCEADCPGCGRCESDGPWAEGWEKRSGAV